MSKGKILIVDDDPGILAMLKLMLRLEGYEPVACEDARQVVHTIDREKPDLVLLDAMMPQLDGIRVLENLRASNLQHHPPVLLFTGNADESYIRRALDSGASGLVVKPFAKEDLLERLQAYLMK
jgi:Response regulators consisting of a CheY-like receiver domain and a winged-helix DNA-binding domain